MVGTFAETEHDTLSEEIDTTTPFQQIAQDMYVRWTLDCLVEIAYHVSWDFFARPEFYKRLGNDGTPAAEYTADKILRLRLDYGTKDVADTAQRAEMSAPIFGASDGANPVVANVDKFRSLRKPLLDACTAYAERSVTDPEAGIKASIQSALNLFKSYLNSFNGASIRVSHSQILMVSQTAYAVLRDSGIRQVFGVTGAIDNDWPLTNDDADGALLVRALGEKLQLSPELVFTEEKFQRLRRAAAKGGEAISNIITIADNPTNDDFKTFVSNVYTWAIALRDYGISS